MNCDFNEINNEIKSLKANSICYAEIQKEFIQYLNNEFEAELDEEKDYELQELFDEDIELPLSISEEEILAFLKWRYSLILVENEKSIIESLEAVANADPKKTHRAIKNLENDISDMRDYKRVIKRIIDASNETLNKLDELLTLCDKYGK